MGTASGDGTKNKTSRSLLTRRTLIRTGALAAAALMIPRLARADDDGDWIRVESPVPHRPRPHLTHARFVPPRAMPSAAPMPSTAGARALLMYNAHTGEGLSTVYWENGDYVPGALHEVNYFFRDFRANEVKPIDPRLLDLLYSVHTDLETREPFVLVSGYRSPATNAWLASQTEGVARHSMHIEGKAADVYMPGRQLSFLQRIATALEVGGVGYYPRAGFVHMDTGRVRRW